MEKKKRKKKASALIPILIIIIIVVVAVIVVKKSNNESVAENEATEENVYEGYVEEVESGVKLNTNTALNTAKQLDGLIISNIQLTARSGMTSFTADVVNNTGAATASKNVDVTLIDEDGNELITLSGVIEALENGETGKLILGTTSNYVNAYDFTITEK